MFSSMVATISGPSGRYSVERTHMLSVRRLPLKTHDLEG